MQDLLIPAGQGRAVGWGACQLVPWVKVKFTRDSLALQPVPEHWSQRTPGDRAEHSTFQDGPGAGWAPVQ